MKKNRLKKIAQKTCFKLIDLCIPYGQTSFSQEGEDLILQRYFETQPRGFFVDVGAHHPIRYSNTFHFYQRGWRGINIDACPGSMTLFQKLRPKDINLEIGVGSHVTVLDYHMFDEPALNSFDKALSEKRDQETEYRMIDKKSVQVVPLKNLLDRHLKDRNQQIDFMNIDVEGLDLEVLKSNDWKRYAPSLIITESLENSIPEILTSDVNEYLVSVGYQLYAKTINSVIFQKHNR